MGLRFLNVTVPQGATITNAYIQFTVDDTDAVNTATLTVHGEAHDNAPTFTTTANDISTRTKTSASVPWSPPQWTVIGESGLDQRTADISTIVKEIVDRGTWASGNAMVMIITGTGVRSASSYDTPADAAVLHIEYGAVPAVSLAAAEDTKLFGFDKNTVKRVRFEISNEGVSTSGPVTYQLQFAETATCSAGTYTTVATDGSSHWQVTDSAFITDGEATSNISPGLTDEATTFVSGELKDAGNTTGSITLNRDEFTEIEFSVLATNFATDGADYCFRLYDATNNQVLQTYSIYAEVQLAPGTPTNYRSIGGAPDYTTGTLVPRTVLLWRPEPAPPGRRRIAGGATSSPFPARTRLPAPAARTTLSFPSIPRPTSHSRRR